MEKSNRLEFYEHPINRGFRSFVDELPKEKQPEVLEILGVARGTLYNWRVGRYIPSVENFIRIVLAMNRLKPGAGFLYFGKVALSLCPPKQDGN